MLIALESNMQDAELADLARNRLDKPAAASLATAGLLVIRRSTATLRPSAYCWRRRSISSAVKTVPTGYVMTGAGE